MINHRVSMLHMAMVRGELKPFFRGKYIYVAENITVTNIVIVPFLHTHYTAHQSLESTALHQPLYLPLLVRLVSPRVLQPRQRLTRTCGQLARLHILDQMKESRLFAWILFWTFAGHSSATWF